MSAPAVRITGTAAGLVLLACVSACTAGGTMAQSQNPTDRPSFHTTTRGPVTPSSTPGAVPADVPIARWQAVVTALADRGITEAPALVSSERVTWPNGALGCPQPGLSYTQALVEGMRVMVTAAGATYDFRFGTSDVPILCTR